MRGFVLIPWTFLKWVSPAIPSLPVLLVPALAFAGFFVLPLWQRCLVYFVYFVAAFAQRAFGLLPVTILVASAVLEVFVLLPSWLRQPDVVAS